MCDLTKHFLRMPLWFFLYLIFPPLQAIFGHPVKIFFFALIKQVFLQTLMEMIFRYN